MAWDEELRRARRRALRAAQVVSIGLALAGGGCSSREMVDPGMVDSGGGDVDAGRGVDSGGGNVDAGGDVDAGSGGEDAGMMMADAGRETDAGRLPDAGPLADAACVPETVDHDCYCDPARGPGLDADCCTMSGGFWVPGGGCAVPGPFVPPTVSV